MNTPIYLLLQSAIGLLVIALNILMPDFALQSRYFLLAIVILVIGMPHGALDHWIDGKINGWNPEHLNKVFYGWYLALIAVYSLLWVFFPFFSFMFFLLITMYHFGQADAERFSFQGLNYRIIQFSRGITVVGLIVFSDLSYASSVIESVSDISIMTYIPLEWRESIRWGLALFYPVIFVFIGLLEKMRISEYFVYLIDALVVSALFIYSDPVWAFSIYFGIWHAFNHSRIMLDFLSGNIQKLDFSWFFKKSFIFSLLSYIGLLILYNYLNAFGNEELLISLLFVVISVLTLPHMIVVEKLYSVRK